VRRELERKAGVGLGVEDLPLAVEHVHTCDQCRALDPGGPLHTGGVDQLVAGGLGLREAVAVRKRLGGNDHLDRARDPG
jgi:hypothetical protein